MKSWMEEILDDLARDARRAFADAMQVMGEQFTDERPKPRIPAEPKPIPGRGMIVGIDDMFWWPDEDRPGYWAGSSAETWEGIVAISRSNSDIQIFDERR